MTADFLARGLARGEKVYYFDDGTSDAVLERMAEDRVPVAGPLRRGQLEIVSPDITRGAFHTPLPDVRDLLLSYIDMSERDGWTGFRMTGQMSYGATRPAGIPLSSYDAVLDGVLEARDSARALCLYDRTRYTDQQIEEMRGVHREEITAPAAYDDGLLRITRTGLGRARLAGEIDHSNRPMITRLVLADLDKVLRAASAPTDIVLNLASLRFLDVTTAVSVVQVAEGFPDTHRLVLTGVRPRVQRVFDRCGAAFARQLTIVELSEARGEPGVPADTGVAERAASAAEDTE
ncbi:MAG: MEDS domain-containing protein [Pseudonocardia sp.]|nr:MEDS domain-containing protein [Pseudonocardia sp.]